MASGKRSHPTASLGIMPEKNTVHAFGAQGHETSGWPYQPSGTVGTPIMGSKAVYRPPRMTQSELGSLGRTHSTSAYKLRKKKR